MIEPMTISPADAEELYECKDGEVAGNWRRITEVEGDDHRWEREMTLVIQSIPSGQLYGIDFRVGLTEGHDNTYPWGSRWAPATAPIELCPMERHEVVRIEYRRAGA